MFSKDSRANVSGGVISGPSANEYQTRLIRQPLIVSRMRAAGLAFASDGRDGRQNVCQKVHVKVTAKMTDGVHDDRIKALKTNNLAEIYMA